MIKTIKWVASPRRKDKKMGAQQPVMPSEYFKILCEIGAGFNRYNRRSDRSVIK